MKALIAEGWSAPCPLPLPSASARSRCQSLPAVLPAARAAVSGAALCSDAAACDGGTAAGYAASAAVCGDMRAAS
eukprot:2515926-Rhodomonas_salina.1